MGFRFRKSKNFGPVRINLSKSGVGWSLGTKGARYTHRADGKKQTTLSIPGTGISYVDVKGNSKKKSLNNYNENIHEINTSNNVKLVNKWTIFILCLFLGPFGIHKFYQGKIGIGILYFFTCGIFLIGWVIDLISILFKPNQYYV